MQHVDRCGFSGIIGDVLFMEAFLGNASISVLMLWKSVNVALHELNTFFVLHFPIELKILRNTASIQCPTQKKKPMYTYTLNRHV